MNEEFERVEQLLRSAQAPTAMPPGLMDAAREAALGSGPERHTPTVVAMTRPRLPRFRFARLSAGVAVMAAAAAAALLIGVGGRGPSFDSQGTLALAGPAGASATVDFGNADEGTRPMEITIHNLKPAGPGWYYEMWFRVPGGKVSAATFNTSASGEATLRTAISGDMHWGRCWVTKEKVGDVGQSQVVLRST